MMQRHALGLSRTLFGSRLGIRLSVFEKGLDLLGFFFNFVGQLVWALGRVLSRKGHMQAEALRYQIEECGARALPIVSLIAILTGVIMAFVGIIQLKQFGAQIYIADLVSLAMVREMGALMVGILLSGRTGSAFAAHLGTMKLSEEIDALRTMAISPMEFLVLPRVLAVLFMIPLLCLYADFLGILGGWIVSFSLLENVSMMQYLNQTRSAFNFGDLSVGLIKSLGFGVVIGLSGCIQGLQCGRSPSAVGKSATRAVVWAITFIVILDAFFAFFFNLIEL